MNWAAAAFRQLKFSPAAQLPGGGCRRRGKKAREGSASPSRFPGQLRDALSGRGAMDVAVDLYVVVPLLFTVLAVILASVFVKLRFSEEDKAAEPPAGAKAEEAAKASAAGVDRTDGDALAKDEREPEAPGAEPRKKGKGEEEEEKEVINGEAGRGAVEEIGAEEGTADGKEERRKEKGKGEEVEDEAAPEALKAEQRSRVQEEPKVPSQAARDAVVAAPVALEEPEDEEEEEEDDDEEEESKEEDQESENEKLVIKEPETEDADEKFSFQYSPGKLRGNQYKTMMTKEELEEEQRTEDYMKLSLDSS